MYENSADIRSQGVQLELTGELGGRLEANASYSLQRAHEGGLSADNMPRHVGKFRAATPIVGSRLWFSASLQYVSACQTSSAAWRSH